VRQFSSARQRLSANSPQHAVRSFDAILLLVLFAIVAAALPAAAQSEWQLYGGTSFLWAKTSPYAQQFNLDTQHEFGWQTDISQYPWRWFGGTLESSGFYGRPNLYDPANNQTYSNLLNVKTYTMMFGPTFAYMHSPRFQPFGHVLLGGIYRGYSLTSKADPDEILNGQTPSREQWIFGWALGGGADITINRLVAIRGQMDWLPSTFKNLDNDRQNNFRVTVGLVFRFGGAEDPTRAQLKPPKPMPSSTPSTDDDAGSASVQGQQPAAQHTSVASANSPNIPSPASAAVASVNPATTVAASPPSWPASQTSASPAPVQAGMTANQASLPPRQPTSTPTSELQPGGASVEQPPASQPTSALPASIPPVMVEFWSRPTGADVEVDGQYVGSTFSTIAIPAGEHTITVRMKDFATWQRTIKITSGNVRVAAYLEQVRATITFH